MENMILYLLMVVMIIKLLKMIEIAENISNAIIIFHDIDASSCDGPRKLWKSILKQKNKNMKTYQYVCKNYKIKYGLGIIVFS